MPISAVDSLSPAFEHTKQQLFRPFNFGQWTRLALVGLFAGELSSGGGCNFNIPTHGSTNHRDFLLATPHNWALLVPLVVIALITLPLLWLLLIYVNSRMRFVLFDSVIAKRCDLGRMWRARSQPALQYFLWQVVFFLATLAGTAVPARRPRIHRVFAGMVHRTQGAPRAINPDRDFGFLCLHVLVVDFNRGAGIHQRFCRAANGARKHFRIRGLAPPMDDGRQRKGVLCGVRWNETDHDDWRRLCGRNRRLYRHSSSAHSFWRARCNHSHCGESGRSHLERVHHYGCRRCRQHFPADHFVCGVADFSSGDYLLSGLLNLFLRRALSAAGAT